MSTAQKLEMTINQAREEVNSATANLLNQLESNKADAFSQLPSAIERWAEVIRANRPLLDELRFLAEAAHVQIPFGYGLLPDLSNPVIGTTRVNLADLGPSIENIPGDKS